MVMKRDETSFLQEAHIARRVLDTFAQGLTMNNYKRHNWDRSIWILQSREINVCTMVGAIV